MEVIKVEFGTDLYEKLINYAENCSWISGKHLAQILRENKISFAMI